MYKNYVRPAIPLGSEAWCLKVSDIGIFSCTKRSILVAMCGVELKDRKRVKDLMLMLGLNEAVDQLVVTNNVCLYGHVLRREDGHVLRRALGFEVDGQRKKRRLGSHQGRRLMVKGRKGG